MNVKEAIKIVMKDREKGMFAVDFAEEVNENHDNVVRDIRNFVSKNPEHKYEFIICWYEDEEGEVKTTYYLTAKAKELMFNKYNTRAAKFELGFEQLLKGIFTSEPVITQMPVLDYRVDFYIPIANMIIEYDEDHHKYQQHEDEIRMERIKKELKRKIVEGEPLFEGDEAHPNPWLKGRDIIQVIRVKQGEEIDGLRRILYAIENDGTSILHLIS